MAINVAEQRRDPQSLLNWMERMIPIGRCHGHEEDKRIHRNGGVRGFGDASMRLTFVHLAASSPPL